MALFGDDNPYAGFLSAAGGMFGNMFQPVQQGFQAAAPTLGALFGEGGGNPASGANNGILGTLSDLYDAHQGSQIANQTNQQVQGINQQQQAAISGQIEAMRAQAAQQRAAAQAAYEQAQGGVGTSNQQLQGTIGTMTNSLNALSDPNSPYMQQARQAIERKDAAAGRRSQWGERETQLAGMLANNVSQYAPGLNNSISAAQKQIADNNMGLANIFNTMNTSGSLTDANIQKLIDSMNQASQSANTTGRQAANAAQGAQAGLVNSGIGALGQGIGAIGKLFGLGGGTGTGISDYYNNLASQQYGITGMGSGLGGYGLTDNNYGPTFGGGSISSGLSNGYNPYGSSLGGGYSGGYSSGFSGINDNVDYSNPYLY